jgi:hypothetical protein
MQLRPVIFVEFAGFGINAFCYQNLLRRSFGTSRLFVKSGGRLTEAFDSFRSTEVREVYSRNVFLCKLHNAFLKRRGKP